MNIVRPAIAGIANLVAFVLVAFVLAAGAMAAEWPITPTVEYPQAQAVGPAGATASVHIRVDDEAAAIEVEVYGLDGMRAGDANRIQVYRDRLEKGAAFAFEVPFHPGPGRSYLTVSAKAHFAHAGTGGTVRSFPFGEENTEQQREHTRCVRQDPQGVWIRVLGCEDGAAADATALLADKEPISPASPPTAGSNPPPPVLTVAQFRAAPPIGQTARMVGYVVETYRCPPCPRGAQCKPCATLSAIFLADAPDHAPFALDRPPADVAAIATPDPDRFERGAQYRLEFAVTDRRRDHFDGQLRRSQRPDREPIWTDSGQ